MKINKEKTVVTGLVEKLNEKFKNKPYTESTVEAIQDEIENNLLTYSKNDIDNSLFLNVSLTEEFGTTETALMQFFIANNIYMTVRIQTVIGNDGFMKISEVLEIKIN